MAKYGTFYPFLNMHTMYLDRKKAAEYGHLVSWDENDEAMMDCVTRMAY